MNRPLPPRRPVPQARLRAAIVTGICFGVLLALPAAGQYFGKNRIQYRDFEWQIYHRVVPK